MAYTPPLNNAIDFQLEVYTPPVNNAISFELSGVQNINVVQTTESETAQPISRSKKVNVSTAFESDEAFAIELRRQVQISQVVETNSPQIITRIKKKSLCTSSNYEIYIDAVAGATKYLFFLEKQSDNPYHLIEGMDYLNDGLAYMIGESASPTFSITLPDDGAEYTSGIVVETGVGVYSGMQVQLFNTESGPLTETDLAQSASIVKRKTIEQAIETDSADDIIPTAAGVYLVLRVDETEEALPITAQKIYNISTVEEIEFAIGLTAILKRLEISFAEETDLSNLIYSSSGTKYIEVMQIIENDLAKVMRSFNPAKINDNTLGVNYINPISANVINGDSITSVLTRFETEVSITQETIQVNYETPYLQEHN